MTVTVMQAETVRKILETVLKHLDKILISDLIYGVTRDNKLMFTVHCVTRDINNMKSYLSDVMSLLQYVDHVKMFKFSNGCMTSCCDYDLLISYVNADVIFRQLRSILPLIVTGCYSIDIITNSLNLTFSNDVKYGHNIPTSQVLKPLLQYMVEVLISIVELHVSYNPQDKTYIISLKQSDNIEKMKQLCDIYSMYGILKKYEVYNDGRKIVLTIECKTLQGEVIEFKCSRCGFMFKIFTTCPELLQLPTCPICSNVMNQAEYDDERTWMGNENDDCDDDDC